MTSKRLWLAGIAAALGFSATGCQTHFGGMTLPSPRYLMHQPQYFPDDPTFPLPRELGTMTDPAGAGGAGAAANLAPAALPVPVQPAPAPAPAPKGN